MHGVGDGWSLLVCSLRHWLTEGMLKDVVTWVAEADCIPFLYGFFLFCFDFGVVIALVEEGC